MTIATSAITVLRRLLDGLLLALVAVSLGVLLLGRLLPLLGHPTLVVAGPSMGSAVPIGSAVILDHVPASDLAVGDVVSLRSGPDRAIFTHRITRIADPDGSLWLETRGDANASPDPSLTPVDAVIGRVGLSVPFAGYLVTLYSVPIGLVFVISLGLVLLTLAILLEPRPLVPTVAPTVSERVVAPPADPGPPGADVAAALAATVAAPGRHRAEPTWPTAPGHVHGFDRRTAKEVVRASRERRARHARWTDPSRRSGLEA